MNDLKNAIKNFRPRPLLKTSYKNKVFDFTKTVNISNGGLSDLNNKKKN